MHAMQLESDKWQILGPLDLGRSRGRSREDLGTGPVHDGGKLLSRALKGEGLPCASTPSELAESAELTSIRDRKNKITKLEHRF